MPSSTTSFNIEKIRKDFPNLHVQVKGKPLAYLDNAATTFKPQVVIDALALHYKKETSNVHRGVHTLSEKATAHFELTRETVKRFINAKDVCEIIFTCGTTDSINLVSHSFGQLLNKGDEIIITEMEHHSNIVPWQMLCEERGCVLKVVPMNDDGELIFDEYVKLLNKKTKLVSVVHISNSLGTINPIKEIIEEAHKNDVPVFIDAAQSISHTKIDVQSLDCDFLAFSSHKLFGPTGVGVLYGKKEWLEKMPPYRGGGDMIASVDFNKTIYNVLPHKFEAGTPNVAGVIGLKVAIDYVTSIGLDHIAQYKNSLLAYGIKKLKQIPDIRLIGTAKKKISILSFIHPLIHAHDMGTLVDEEGIAIRTGHHCTQPVMKHFGVPATSRASLTFYNTTEELDRLVQAILRAEEIFK